MTGPRAAPHPIAADSDSDSTKPWPPPGRVPTPIRNILQMVALDTRVSIKTILSDALDPDVIAARGGAVYLARSAGHEVPAIAHAFGCDLAWIEEHLAVIGRWLISDAHLAGWLASFEFVLTMPAEDGA